MPQIDVVDSTWIAVSPARVGALLADTARWPAWWPDLELVTDEARGAKGMRWLIPSALDGRLSGSGEVWLQPVDGGTVAHYFLRLDPAGAARGVTLRPRERERLVDGFRRRAKQVMWAIADELDPGRLARVAEPASQLSEPVSRAARRSGADG